MNGKTSVEIFIAPGCTKCGYSVALVKSLHHELGSETFDWRWVDVVAELDYAVKMGVRATPGIAIDGRLLFTAQPTKAELRAAIRQANGK